MPVYKDFLDEVPEYIVKTMQYARVLIDENIWDTITHDDLDNWLSNFKEPDEQLLAGLLLENLIHRSSEQTKSLLTAAIDVAISSALYPDALEELKQDSYYELLTNTRGQNSIVKIIPVIRDFDPPTKSGPSVARLYKRLLKVSENYMTWPWMIKDMYDKGARLFIFIDDTLATGEQFNNFFESVGYNSFPEADFVYIPLLAHHEGSENVKRKYPKLLISPVEVIDNSYNFFNKNIDKIEDIEDLYLKVAKKFLNKRFFNKMSKGYKDLGITFSYAHSTPNATLPLYWYEDERFSPLVRR